MPATAVTKPAKRSGVTLVELLIALAIGAFLAAGALRIYTQARAAYRSVEIVARLHQNARFALAQIEPEARMAGFLGLTANPNRIVGRAGPADPVSIVPESGDCGRNWSVDLDHPVSGSNGVWTWTCHPRGTWAPGSDTLVIRRAAVRSAMPPLDADTVYVRSSRSGSGVLFRGSTPPATAAEPGSAVHPLAVSGYYVSENSVLDTAGAPVPSLRKKTLRGLRIVDEEVMPGVEDMQIQFGIDTDPHGTPGRGAVDRFVDADDPALNAAHTGYLPKARILALRIWVRLRSDMTEPGYRDGRTYAYAGRQYTPAGKDRRYRRALVSKTIYLRNAAARP